MTEASTEMSVASSSSGAGESTLTQISEEAPCKPARPTGTLSIQDFSFIKVLGKGSFGKVRFCILFGFFFIKLECFAIRYAITSGKSFSKSPIFNTFINILHRLVVRL